MQPRGDRPGSEGVVEQLGEGEGRSLKITSFHLKIGGVSHGHRESPMYIYNQAYKLQFHAGKCDF